MQLTKAPELLGNLDGINNRTIRGWAIRIGDTAPLLSLAIDGKPIIDFMPNMQRQDIDHVRKQGAGAGFELELPNWVIDGEEHIVELRFAETGELIPNGRISFRASVNVDTAQGLARWVTRSGYWHVDAGWIVNNELHLHGWSALPEGAADQTISIDGAPMITAREPDVGLTQHIGLPENYGVNRFKVRAPIPRGAKEVSLRFGPAPRGYNRNLDYFLPLGEIKMPSNEQMMRVAGHHDTFKFNLEGNTTAKRLADLAQRFTGKPIEKIGNVLDWGCGCGRVARFLAPRCISYYGVDIDEDNMRWCSKNSAGIYSRIYTKPPTSFDGRFFDLIFGVSVFPHLDENHMHLWLREMKRIARPGGILLFSILGGTFLLGVGRIKQLSLKLSNGFVDLGKNKDIDGILDDKDYYRNVWISHGKVREQWGQYFDILDIVEGAVGNIQDVVVLRAF